MLATAVEGQIRLWFLPTGQPLGPPILQSMVSVLQFTRDGTILLAGDTGGLVRVWQVFRSLPEALLTESTVEAITGHCLSDEGVVERLDDKSWSRQLADWRATRSAVPAAALPPASRALAAALERETPTTGTMFVAGLEQLAERPDGWLARLLRTRWQLSARHLDLARSEIKTAIDVGPADGVRAWLKHLARQQLLQDQRSDARWYLDRLVEMEMADADVYLAQAELSITDERPDDTSEWLQRAIDSRPATAALFRSVGELEYRLQNWTAAVDRLTRSLELGGGNAEVWQMRATCYAQMGEWDLAGRDLAKAVQRHPRNSELREQLAVALVSAGNQTGYQELCADTVANFDLEDYARRPWTAPSLLVLAPDGLSDYETIIQPAQAFADRYPGDCVSYHILGPYCYRAGQFDRSARAQPPLGSRQVVRADELLFRAMAFARTGNQEAARLTLREVSEIPWQRSNVWQRQQIQLLLTEVEQLLAATKLDHE